MKPSALLVCFWLMTPLSASAADVTSYFVSKGITYSQTNSGAPQLKPSPYVFHARADVSNATALTQGTLNRGIFIDNITSKGTRIWSLVHQFSQASGFNPFFPDGPYTLVLYTAHVWRYAAKAAFLPASRQRWTISASAGGL